MHKIKHLRALSVGTLGLITVLAGCSATEQSLTGVTQAAANPAFIDFSYIGLDGNIRSLSKERADVTVVLFPTKSDENRCQSILQIANNVQRQGTPVAVYAVKPNGNDSGKVTSSSLAGDDLEIKAIAIHDSNGILMSKFGDEYQGKYFILDSQGTVRYSGMLDNTNALKKQAGWVVRQHEKELALPRDCWDC